MATYRPASSISTAVLQIFKDQIGTSSAWTVEEIWQVLRQDVYMPYRDIEFDFYFFRDHPDTPVQWITTVLKDLAKLGLVKPANSPEESSGFSRWSIGDSWHPPEPPSGDGGGGGGDRINPGADDGDSDGGGGLQEVLGHPVLLALDQDDFDDLVEGLFEEV